MAPPSALAIATSAVSRLVKEKASYQKELEQQEARLKKSQQAAADGEENADYQIKQEERAIEETKAMFPQLSARIKEALAKLEDQLQVSNGSVPEGDTAKANQAVADARASGLGEA